MSNSEDFNEFEQQKSQELVFYQILEKMKKDYENIMLNKDQEIKEYVVQLAEENVSLKNENFQQKEINCSLQNKLDVIEQIYPVLYLAKEKNDNIELDSSLYTKLNFAKENYKKEIEELEGNFIFENSKINQEFESILKKYNDIMIESTNMKNEEKMENLFVEMLKQIKIYQKKIMNLRENILNKEKLEIHLVFSKTALKEENEFIKSKLIREKINIIQKLKEFKAEMEIKIKLEKKNLFDEKILKENEEFRELFHKLGYSDKQQSKMEALKLEKEKIMKQNFEMYTKINELTDQNQILNEQIEILQKSNQECEEVKKEYNENIENLNIKSVNFENEIETLHNIIKQLNNKILEKENELSAQIATSKVKEVSTQNEINMLSSKLSSTINEFNNMLDQKESAINELTNENIELKDLNEHLNDLITEKEAEMNKCKEEIIHIKNDLYEKEIKVNQQDDQIEILTKSKEQKEITIKELTDNINKLNAILANITDKNKKNEDYITQLKESNDTLSKNYNQITMKYENVNEQYQRAQNDLNTLKSNTITEKEKYISYDSKIIAMENENISLKKKNEILANENTELKYHINNTYEKYIQLDIDKSNNNVSKDILMKKEEIIKIKEIFNNIDSVSYLALNVKNSSEKVTQYESEIQKLKTRINTLLNLASGNVTRINGSKIPKTNNYTKISQSQLYEKIIKYIRDLNIFHEIQMYKLTIQHEDQITNLISANSINKKDNILESAIQTSKLSINEVLHLVEGIEVKLKANNDYFEKRLKLYVNIEDVKTTISNTQKQYENVIGSLLEKFLSYNVVNDKNSPFLLLKMPINEYNDIIENAMKILEETIKNINEFYKDISDNYDNSVETAFDAIINLTFVKNDLNNTNNSSRINW